MSQVNANFANVFQRAALTAREMQAGHRPPVNVFIRPVIVSQQMAGCSNGQCPVPSRFAQSNQPTPYAARFTAISRSSAGVSEAVTVPYAERHHVPSSTSLTDLKRYGAALREHWPADAGERVQRVGSRENHRHKYKDYVISLTNGVLQVDAQHRPGSKLEVHPDGRLVMGGKEVTEDCTDRVRRRVASRLSAAMNAAAPTGVQALVQAPQQPVRLAELETTVPAQAAPIPLPPPSAIPNQARTQS